MPDVLVHLANALFLVSYLVRDILWLRALCTGAAACLAVAFYRMAPTAWALLCWQLVFIVINGVQIALLLQERRPMALDPDAALLRQLVLRPLLQAEFRAMLGLARFESAAPGELLVRAGAMPADLVVVLRGQAEVRGATGVLAVLGPGRLVGEMSFVTGALPTADVVAHEGTRVVRFDRAALERLFARRPDVGRAVHAVLGVDLVAKLRATQA